MEKKYKIKISVGDGGKVFIKQAPHLEPIWKNCEFFINEDIPECDLWVVWGRLARKESTRCPKGATLFITNEPPSVDRLSKRFTEQFGAIMTCENGASHKNIIYSQQALPWWVGHRMCTDDTLNREYEKTYDELKSIIDVPKTKTLSIISSNKQFTEGHRLRYNFAQFIKKELGDQVDVFGVGGNMVEDKWDAIAPYKYHIVIENSTFNDYWSEKLTDSFLAQSYPFYYGAPNINKYFSEDMLTTIDITQPEKVLETIKKVIANNTYETSVESIKKAKDLILDTYQIFPMLCAYVNEHIQDTEKVLTTLAPERQSGIVPYIKKCVKALLRIIHVR